MSRQGKTTAEAALVVLQGSLLGLAAAHRRGVVHRDYKPENVLIDGAGASKLTDFGIAARAGDSPIPAGTLAYAPPEQFAGSPVSPATDVYAATATFYECLTGRPPFTGDTAERLLYQHLSEAVPMEPVPEPLRPLMAAGLAKDPGHRPADGTALVAELRTVAAGAYGPGWEDRGRSQLAAAALLLAALWPTGGPAAVQGTAVHRIPLRRHLRPRHISPVKAAIAAGVAVAVAAVLATHSSSAGPTAAPFTVSGDLTGVAATSADNAWAVGCTGIKCTKTLILRWNGTTWAQVPSPNPGQDSVLTAVSAVSASSAWAFGYTGASTGPIISTLILHWNGTTWTRVPSPNLGDHSITGASSASDGTAWAIVGSGNNISPLLLRWNGNTWTLVPNPPAGSHLSSVAATPASTAWAVGYTGASASARTLILRWNGTAWTRVPSLNPGPDASLQGVTALSSSDAWAVGYSDGKTLILRWNGQIWSVPAGQVSAAALDAGRVDVRGEHRRSSHMTTLRRLLRQDPPHKRLICSRGLAIIPGRKQRK